MSKVFISYNKADRQWAEWIGWQLEEKQAREVLIKKMKRERLKPDTPPVFPSPAFPIEARAFPRKPDFPMDHITVSRLPVTDSAVFGRETEVALLDEAWKDEHANVVTLIAWGGVGKTALVNHWLNGMAKDHFRGAEKVYGWSFYSQGAAEGKQASADEFMQETLRCFGGQNWPVS